MKNLILSIAACAFLLSSAVRAEGDPAANTKADAEKAAGDVKADAKADAKKGKKKAHKAKKTMQKKADDATK